MRDVIKGIRLITRREFIRNTGLAGGGLILAAHFPVFAGDEPQTGGNFAPNVYVNLLENGDVEIVCHRSEMGQGVRTSVMQVIADEMEADWDRVTLLQATGDAKYGDQNTDGSTSIRKQFDLLRNAGAVARHMLVAAAAETWGVPASDCVGRNHAVHHQASGKSLGYGELAGKAATLPVPAEVEFKSPREYRYIGKPMDLVDGMAFTVGTAAFGIDTVVPGMLYASIERCPVFGGTLVSVDDAAAREVAGVVAVIQLGNATSPPAFNPLGGVAVLATNTWSAQKGREALKIVWDLGANASYNSDDYRKQLESSVHAEGSVVLARGDVDTALAGAAKTLEATYYAPHLSQAPMEPPAAVARVNADGSCEVWACTQDPQTAQGVVAGALGIEPAQVTINVTLLGGAFGRKSKPDFIAEAALLAKKAGKPVKVTWTREDDIRHGYFHSVSAQYLRGGIDADGKVTAWQQRTAFPSINSTFGPSDGPGGGELGLGCIDNPYAIENMKIESCKAAAHVRIGWLRSVSNVYHAFAASSFADELAHLAGRDPKDFLLELIGPDRHVKPADSGAEYDNYGHDIAEHPIDTARLKGVLAEAAKMAGWGRTLPAGRGLGIAVHRSFLGYVATAAQVSVSATGDLRVEELWTAVDAGTVVNPDRVRAQMEGAGIFGMSLAMHSEITADDGAIVQGNFNNYRVIRMNEAPKAINVHVMPSNAKPGGVGEPGVPPVAPAICNAIFAATGKRVRELPLRNVKLA
jgi:isoquinoline 1-oxidoreductase beta subunit